jgi:hypothetical protein
MSFFLLKAIISGLIAAAVSSLGKKFPAFAGLLAALPIISLLALSFLYRETEGNTLQVARLSHSIGWMALPTILFLFFFPVLLKRQLSFPVAALISLCVMLVLHGTLFLVLQKLGVNR